MDLRCEAKEVRIENKDTTRPPLPPAVAHSKERESRPRERREKEARRGERERCESIDNKLSESDDSQSSESIDTKPSTSVDALRVSEQAETEKFKSWGRNKNKKKKKKRNSDADSLSVVPLQCQEGSLEYRVRCRGGYEPFTKVRVLCDPELR
ncbi:hypothetical protein F2Q68_00025023 [Brassica cretica]|uniref:Uncharacterized protein n=1 Tax=Brassica cretica TaxID=69181 RepID=A0A8S9II02_BRACR|nr:hypothetical protein F2Q68_00025023 [Brassica cretica]